jgi:hypothetical protein
MVESRVVWGLLKPLIYVAFVSSCVVGYETLLKVRARVVFFFWRVSGVCLSLRCVGDCVAEPTPPHQPAHPFHAARPPPPNPAQHHLIVPDWMPHVNQVAKEPFGLTSFALSLLLVFRTNARCARSPALLCLPACRLCCLLDGGGPRCVGVLVPVKSVSKVWGSEARIARRLMTSLPLRTILTPPARPPPQLRALGRRPQDVGPAAEPQPRPRPPGGGWWWGADGGVVVVVVVGGGGGGGGGALRSVGVMFGL